MYSTQYSKQAFLLPCLRYVNDSDKVEGPFTADEMIAQLQTGFPGPSVLVCGAERKVGPPHLPPRKFYRCAACVSCEALAAYWAIDTSTGCGG
jgi:hypothetical protein